MASPLRPMLARIIVVLLLTAGTVGFFNLYERYEPIGEELLSDAGFSAGFAHWTLSGRGAAEIVGGSVVLRADEPAADVAVRQPVADPGRFQLLELQGELAAGDIRPGTRFWQRGYLALVSFDQQRHMMRAPHVVAELEGTRPWQAYRKVFHVPREAQELRVTVQLIGATGTLAFKNLSLREVRERGSYTLYRHLWIAGWALVLIWLIWPLRSRLRLDLPHAMAGLALAGIFAGTLMPVGFKTTMESGIGTVLARVIRLGETEAGGGTRMASGYVLAQHLALDKLGHAVFFALLAVGVRWAYPRARRSSLLLGLLLLACVSEVLQFFVDGRLPRMTDLLIDLGGLVLGMALFDAARGLRRWREHQEPS